MNPSKNNMAYNVNVVSIAEDVPVVVQKSILTRLESYDFPFVSTVPDKKALRSVFTDYFQNRRNFSWLKNEISKLVTKKQGIVSTAMTETNRLHTGGLSDVLLSKGITKCTTVHSYGMTPISPKCRKHIHEKELNIETILKNSFPEKFSGLNADIPMIPEHVSCRHVMAPLDESVLN